MDMEEYVTEHGEIVLDRKMVSVLVDGKRVQQYRYLATAHDSDGNEMGEGYSKDTLDAAITQAIDRALEEIERLTVERADYIEGIRDEYARTRGV